jgi:hypothetical protein
MEEFTTPVATFLRVTAAFGTVEPVASNTVPVKFPLVICATRSAEVSVDISNTKSVYPIVAFKEVVTKLKHDRINGLFLITASGCAIHIP